MKSYPTKNCLKMLQTTHHKMTGGAMLYVWATAHSIVSLLPLLAEVIPMLQVQNIKINVSSCLIYDRYQKLFISSLSVW